MIHRVNLIPNVTIIDPTWGNHINIFKKSGLQPLKYRYFNRLSCVLDLDGMLQDINDAPKGSTFLLHACAHNPTGCDPTHAQWDIISSHMKQKNHIIFFDCAYQGFASGDSEKDAYAIRKFVEDGHFVAVSQSFAKVCIYVDIHAMYPFKIFIM